MRIHYSIVFVSDMARSVAFYRDVVGIPVKFETPGWTEFVTEGATLALHKSETPAPEGDGRSAEAAGTCRTGFEVPDLDAFHRRMVDHDVRCVQEPATTFGARLAQYLDPDGMILGIGEEPSAKE